MTSDRTARRNRQQRREYAGISPDPTPLAYQEITVPGSWPIGGFENKELLKYDPVSIERLRLMMDMDGHARGIFNILRRPIQRNARSVEIHPGKDDNGEAEFIEDMIKLPRQAGGMSTPFTRIIGQQCMAMVDGFAPFQKVFLPPGSVVDDGYVRLKKLAYRDPRTISFNVDDNGGFDGFHQRASWKGRMIDRNVQRDYACYYAVNEPESPLYGKSYFLPAYYHFDKKHKAYYMTHLALMVGALPPRIAKSNTVVSAKDKAIFLDALTNLGANSAMLMPNGFELLDKPLEGPTSGLPYMELIAHHNVEMSISTLAQALDIGTNGGGGGFSLSKNHFDFLIMTLEGDQDEMLDMWNLYVIPQLIDWNFGTKAYPTLVMPPFATDVRDMMGEIFGKILAARSLPVSPEFVSQLEKQVSRELGLEVTETALDQNEAQQIAMRDLEEAMAQANVQVALHPPATPVAPGAAKKPVSASAAYRQRVNTLLASPEFISMAESRSTKFRDKLLASARLLDEYDEED